MPRILDTIRETKTSILGDSEVCFWERIERPQFQAIRRRRLDEDGSYRSVRVGSPEYIERIWQRMKRNNATA